jgi:hypothetical protein
MEPIKERVRYYAEGLREVGILILVFGPMYSVFETKDVGWTLLADVLLWLLGGLMTFLFGVEAGRWAR